MAYSPICSVFRFRQPWATLTLLGDVSGFVTFNQLRARLKHGVDGKTPTIERDQFWRKAISRIDATWRNNTCGLEDNPTFNVSAAQILLCGLT
jgi:hypothetical protein